MFKLLFRYCYRLMCHQKDIECSIIDQSDRAEENKIEMKFNEKREEKKKGKRHLLKRSAIRHTN